VLTLRATRKLSQSHREGIAHRFKQDKESHMIKPLEEYSPEDRAFVEYVQKIRSQPPKPPHDPGPLNWDEINAILDSVNWDEEEEPAFQFGRRATDAEG
jgi:hypothetical protein